MSAPEQAGTVIIPEGEKLVYKSELFDVVIRSKRIDPGLTRDRHLVEVELLEQDPLIQRIATLDIPQDIWSQLDVGERVKARLYEHPDKRWLPLPPAGVL